MGPGLFTLQVARAGGTMEPQEMPRSVIMSFRSSGLGGVPR